MRPRLIAALAVAAGLAACQTSVGPVHIGEINQFKALKLAHDELVRRHMEAYADWRAQITDYDKVWVVTYYRPAGRTDGPALVRVSFNKHTEKVVAVDTAD
ncbi:hypothetical protein [Phenylobacterium sp.]|jgi:hypothetical protein|uniref:hypothetical protein n=1 Tax=Phenylobacterium sp. TaxID=1871053 RepID=UPI002F407FD2